MGVPGVMAPEFIVEEVRNGEVETMQLLFPWCPEVIICCMLQG
jgi:hypothetical protein